VTRKTLTSDQIAERKASVTEREAAVDDAIASVELEGFTYDGGVHEILYRHARGEISDAERDAEVDRLVQQIQRDAAARAWRCDGPADCTGPRAMGG